MADAARQPAAASAWLEAWAAHVSSGEPRVAVVRDGATLLGVVPLAAQRSEAGLIRLRLLGAGTSTGVAPLARPGEEVRVAAAAAQALSAGRADALHFDGIPATSPWPQLLAHHWPGARPRLLHRVSTSPEPYVTLDAGSYEAWLAARSSSFRGQVRKVRRRLDKRGVTMRRATDAQELAHDLRAFAALHRSRWDPEGGSAVLSPAVEAMLLEAGPRLLREGRLDCRATTRAGPTPASAWRASRRSSRTASRGAWSASASVRAARPTSTASPTARRAWRGPSCRSPDPASASCSRPCRAAV
jgi:hypothetical protein